MTDISDYDRFDYDYSKYWNKREYEDLSEKYALKKLFSLKKGSWFLDVGGSYGRLSSTYAKDYKYPVILDYSLKTLIKNKNEIQKQYPNIQLIAANAYNLPFKESSFDGGLMVRVLHHIKEPDKYLKEIRRVLGDNATYVQEYANKNHIKAQIRALIKINFKFFSKEPFEQPIGKYLEGSRKGSGGIFFNYHPQYINELFSSLNFKIEKKVGCSFLRSPFVKKFIGANIMLFVEKILQNTLSWTNISPSIILKTRLEKKEQLENKGVYNKLEDILACPSCKKELLFSSDTTAKCNICSLTFLKKDDVWDFRIK